MVYVGNVLFNDGFFVKVGCDKVCCGIDNFDIVVVGLVVGFGVFEVG